MEWLFRWDPPPDVPTLVPQEMRLRQENQKVAFSFENLAAETEKYIGSVPGLICGCCRGLEKGGICNACLHAVGFHRCHNYTQTKWRQGTLFGGEMDFQRVIWNLHRKGLPIPVLKRKADEFVSNGGFTIGMARSVLRTIEDERGKHRIANEAQGGLDGEDNGRVSERLRIEEMQAELDKRVAMMEAGAGGAGITDQARVYAYIIEQLEKGEWLRLMVQASAGTGRVYTMCREPPCINAASCSHMTMRVCRQELPPVSGVSVGFD